MKALGIRKGRTLPASPGDGARVIRRSGKWAGGPLRVAVVGPCASGKTTLVANLRARGVEARSIAQEHSQAPSLYRLHPSDVLVYLDVTYPAVRRRRDVSWGPERLRDEAVRLRDARRDADLVIDTDGLSAQEVLDRTLAYLQEQTRAMGSTGTAPEIPVRGRDRKS